MWLLLLHLFGGGTSSFWSGLLENYTAQLKWLLNCINNYYLLCIIQLLLLDMRSIVCIIYLSHIPLYLN